MTGTNAAHVDLVRHRWPTTAPYQQLRSLAPSLPDDDHFVLTSNVDAMFERNGFDPSRIHTPQGDYALMQCTTPCTREVWEWKDQLDAIRAATDPETQRTNLDLIPRCPNCGEEAWINVRIDRSFIDDHFAPTAEALGAWVDAHADANTVIVEIGAGYNTPGVIRMPGERLTDHFSKLEAHSHQPRSGRGSRRTRGASDRTSARRGARDCPPCRRLSLRVS